MFKNLLNRLKRPLEKYPITSFFVTLAVLVGIIVAGNYFGKPATDTAAPTPPTKNVQTLTIGRNGSTVNISAVVEKEGVIQIMAQTPGIVQKINAQPGQTINAYKAVVSTSNTYSGASAATVQRQIAEKQLQQTTDTYDLQKDLIAKQREIAEQSRENAEKLRDITDQSLEDTRNAINLNQDLLDNLNRQISTLESSNTNGANDQLIATAKQGKAQIQSGLAQLRSGLRQSEYQAGDENAPADLANLQHDVTLKQLELQEKGLDLGRDLAQLQVKLARVNEAFLCPSLPYKATVEAIHVKVGQSVNPGQILATLSTDKQRLTARAAVPQGLAKQINVTEPSRVMIQGEPRSLQPSYISREATTGQLYTISYDLPADYSAWLSDAQHITISVPVMSSETAVMVPLDALYQTQDQAFVFIKNGDKAESKPVIAGQVWGSYVEIASGLTPGSEVILSRNVVAGDIVSTVTN